MSPTSRRAAPAMNGEMHVALDTPDFLAVFPLKGRARVRLIGTVRDELSAGTTTLPGTT